MARVCTKPLALVVGLMLLLGAVGRAPAEPDPKDYPLAAQAWWVQGERFFMEKRFREALEAYKAAEVHGMRGFIRLDTRKAKCHQELREFESAIKESTKVIATWDTGFKCYT